MLAVTSASLASAVATLEAHCIALASFSSRCPSCVGSSIYRAARGGGEWRERCGGLGVESWVK